MDNRVVGKLNENEEFAVESSTSGSVKRSRAPGSGIQVASCLVDGCNSDLSKCRDYHRRHKVCELHSKTSKVTVRGHEQRFCQQCSRFHSLDEFDEGKRSCRKRLDGHNRRRRKPQPEPLHMTSARFLAEYQGTRFLAFDHPQVLPGGPILSCGWGGPVFKLEGRNDQSNGESLSVQRQRQTQFSFLERTKSTFHGYSATELNFDSKCASEKALSNCARSLLSSTPPDTMQPNAIPPPLHLDALGLVGQAHNANTNPNCEAMFDIGPDASSSSAAHHKLFSWEQYM